MPRNDKLQTLMRLLSHREELARRNLAARREAVDGAAARAEELSGLKREYEERLSAAGGAGVRAGDLQMWRRFNQSLDEVVDVQAFQVERLRQELEQAQQECLTALARRRGGELLSEARERDETIRVRRKERTLAADHAGRRHGRS